MNLKEFASSLFLFEGISDTVIDEILNSPAVELRSFPRNETIYSPTEYEKKLGFVVSGKCDVKIIKNDSPPTVLNTLGERDAFGVLAVFSECEEYPTEIIAAKNSDVLFISKDGALNLVKQYPEIAMNVIRFLSGRIGYLNKQLATFSGTRVEHRLASFLFRLYQKHGEEFDFNCKKTSEAINAGRASVYRALDILSTDGIITYSAKQIKIINPSKLKENTK